MLLTSADAEDRQRRLAAALLARGLERGDRIGVTPREAAIDADELCLVAAALRIGIVPVIVNSSLLAHERDAVLADAEVTMIVDRIEPSDDEVELASAPLARPMLYTSGTTGAPKGVWSGVLSNDDAIALLEEEREQWQFAADDRHLVCGALHHSAPLRFALGTLLAGGSVVLPGRFDPATVARAIRAHQPTTTFVAPIHLQRLLAHGGYSTHSFRLVAHAGAPCPEPVKRAALDAFPRGSVWEFYGSTEGQFTVCSPDEWVERPGTVGRARAHRTLSTDDDGLVWCSAPRWARFSYWRDPAKTATTWRGDEFTVGDLGRLDDDGYLYLDGRRDDLIISGGVNVYPAEVERVLSRLPGVDDVVVFPRPDTDWGQRVCAAVVGAVDDTCVRAVLAPHKRPKEIHIVAEIPRLPSGKVRRSTVAQDLGLR
jgi:acyl-CoA synthetase (AMP-forming)/AMP-acid ligase II